MSKDKVHGSRLGRFAPFPRVDAMPESVMRRLLPSLAAMVIILIVGAWAIMWRQQQLADEIAADTSSVVFGDLRTALDQQSAVLAAAAKPIAANAAVQQALRTGDADGLLSAWQPAFETMHRENHLTHFYFLDKNRVCLLRVHNPEQHGDRINRFTALEAERTGKTASGTDLGAMGTFTLRVVQPVFEGGRLVGYVELGEEIEGVLLPMHTRPGIQLAVVIRKEYLNRQAWEDGMRLHGRQADWDRLSQIVVIYASQGRLPDAFASWADQAAGEHTRGKAEREIAFDGKDWRLSVIPLPDASGRQVGNLLIMNDITADKAAFTRLIVLGGTAGTVLLALLLGFIYVLLRRTDAGIHAQQATLRASEVRYRRLFEAAKDGILILDGETGMVVDVNPFLIQLLGLSREAFLGKEIWELGFFKDIVANQDSFTELQQQEYIRYEDKPLKTADGRRVDVEFVSNVYLVDRQKVIQCNIRDISARKQAEEALRGKEHLLSEAQRLGHVGSWLWDLTGPISCSDETYRLHGVSRDTFTPTVESLLSLLHPDDRPAMQAWFAACAAGEKPDELEYRVKMPDGTIRFLMGRGEAVRDSEHRLTHMAGLVQDISERKQAEAEHEELRSHLLQAQKLESIGTLAGGIAHEINNPVMGIMSYAQLIVDQLGPGSPVTEYATEIGKETQRVATIVKNLLSFARVDKDTYKSPAGMCDIVEETLSLIRAVIRHDQITLEVNVPADLPKILCRSQQIQQVIMNLLTNARDALNQKYPGHDENKRIIISASVFPNVECRVSSREPKADDRQSISTRRLRLTVEDHGAGIPQELCERIFDPFFSTKARHKGTGLGLSISHGIVSDHGGALSVESEVGQWTRFNVDLPVVEKLVNGNP